MAELRELIKRRGTFKAKLTNFINFINTISQKPSIQEITEIESRLGRLEPLFTEFDDIQLQIECASDNPDEQYKERETFEQSYYKSYAWAKTLITETSIAATLHSSRQNESFEVKQTTGIKLPEINLIKFDGSYSQWLEFRDMFESMIHNDPSLPNITKFHYLRSYLEGSASLIIRAIEFSASNYEIAWETLCERYNNKRLLISNHVKALFNVFPVQKETSFQLRRLVDTFVKNLKSLEILKEPTQYWDTLLIYILCHKLDPQTLQEWERNKMSHNSDQVLFKELVKFIRSRADMLETLEQRNIRQDKVRSLHSNTHTEKDPRTKKCYVCQSDTHNIYNCKQLLDLSYKERENKIKNLNLCLNCLRSGHTTKHCKLSACRKCNRKHNTLLHYDKGNEPHISSEVVLTCTVPGQGFLSTASVMVIDQNNIPVTARVMLDSGSTSNFITERLCNQLGLETRNISMSVSGINNSISWLKKACLVEFKSHYADFTSSVTCIVIPNITHPWPNIYINKHELNIPKGIRLADPRFNITSDIDILLGSGIFWHLLGTQKIILKNSHVMLYESKLGWIIGGNMTSDNNIHSLVQHGTDIQKECSASQERVETIQDQLAKFWECESIPGNKNTIKLQDECEGDFVQNTTRLTCGRFVVNIPLKKSPSLLGDSYKLARQRFLSLEKKFSKNPVFKSEYSKFIHEYIAMGHMSESQIDFSQPAYFAPHHAVIKKDSLKTKLRVVYDCSAKSSSGYSFNDLQRVGPPIQEDLFSILLRFRQNTIAMTADVEKMYRQIDVNPLQRCLQQILWREESSQPLKCYKLNTVTYGTSAAAFLAVRCLKQLAIETDDELVSQIILRDFYVDDLITSAPTVRQAIEIYTKVTNTLLEGCFPLRHWRSNSKELSESITSNTLDNSKGNLDLCPDHTSKVLGVTWNSDSDDICFNTVLQYKGVINKRSILSITSQLFDPLGLVAPTILEAKLMMQQLWLHKYGWDDRLPDHVKDGWMSFIRNISHLNDLKIPRQVTCSMLKEAQLHIFCDASEGAYGACAYIRSIDPQGIIHVHLLCAKGKVAPISPPLTIPRLELLAALLGSRLANKIIKSMRLTFDNWFLWSDSTIVLGWLTMHASKLHTFVRNRIAEIQSTCSNCTWKHVPSQDNPADHISRGLTADAIIHNELWWHGPSFLSQAEVTWPVQKHIRTSFPELKLTTCLNSDIREIFPFQNFSSFERMKRAFAYVKRFIHNIRNKVDKRIGLLTPDELINSEKMLASIAQRESFPSECCTLQLGDCIKKTKLSSLNPYIDKNNYNLIRVGGRLNNSDYDYNKLHPIILDKGHIFTRLLFENRHRVLMHAGPQMLLYSIRENYWPIGGRNLSRSVVRKCVLCSRFKGNTITPIMGDLPRQRIQPAWPFMVSGVDYAGPIIMADRKGRGCKLIKAYICIFVCFTTKAIHIELVGDLTTANFIAALKRFFARRGRPSDIFCDNGSNFVGACNEIKKFIEKGSNMISEVFASDAIKFHFLPPHAPHFGGLHEAGVKSVKHHLRRVLGLAHLTYEDLYTTLTQIEALLNSRPLTPLSSDITDYLPLTPAHFLIGRTVTSIPEHNYMNTNTHRLNNYEKIQQLRQHFWSRWQQEYISELQVRTKWKQSRGSLNIGTLVLIKDKQAPPLKWLLGRVIRTYPGKDKITRVADIQTAGGIFKRDFTKICPLPVDSDFEDTASTSGSMLRMATHVGAL